MKKKIIILLLYFVLLLLPSVVLADTEQNLSFNMAKCDLSKYSDLSDDEQLLQCSIDYGAGELDSYIIENTGNVVPGDTILGVVRYTPGTIKTTTGMNVAMFYDKNVITIINNPGESTMFYDYDPSVFPKSGRVSGWSSEINNVPETGKLILIASDIVNFKPLINETDIIYFLFRISDSAVPGSNINFDFSDEAGGIDLTDASANHLSYTTTNFVLSVYGEQSRDASLKSISVTNNGTDYPINPSITDGVTTYNVVVPNNITSITLDGEVNNEYAVISALSLGEKTLSVGNNSFTIPVTSQYGDVETYTVNIYRLSNEASLTSLSLDNGVEIENFSIGNYSYSISVLYGKTTTNVSATASSNLQTIASGLGKFDFTNYGETTNVREVVVEAENCKSDYESVPGNTCTSNTYTITVTRGNPSTNKYLSELKVFDSLVPNFDKNDLEYDIGSVSNSTTSIPISGITEDATASITGGTGNINISVGDNTLPVVVTAEDGTTRNYIIKVRRLSNNAKLSGIEVTSNPNGTLTPTFQSSFTGDYTYSYPATATSVSISATVADTDNATISIVDSTNGIISSSSIVYNTTTEIFNVPTVSKVTIVVTAEDGTISYQNINLTRQLSSDANLKSLSLSEGTISPEFNGSTVLYSATVEPSTTSVVVTAEPNSVYGQVKNITGNTNLLFGNNTITISVEAEDGSDKSYIINLTRKKYTDAKLSDIKIDGETIPNFDPETYVYNLPNYTKDFINVSATSNDTTYGTYSGTGNKNLQVGDNSIIITSYAHDTSVTKKYTININKLSNDTSLGSLNITSSPSGSLSPAFQKTYNGEYVYSYPATALEVTVNASVGDSDKARIAIYPGTTTSGDTPVLNSTSKTFTIPETSKVTIVVIAEDGTVGTHVVNFTRQLSSDANLKKLELSEGTLSPEFNGSTALYSATVEPEITNIFVTAEPNSIYGEVKSITGNTNLVFGNNTITITVEAEDGSDKSYVINVNREKYSDARLSDIKIDDVTISDFDKDDYEYTINDCIKDSIVLKATSNDITYGTNSGTGRKSLKVGENRFVITSYAHNTSIIKRYTIIVNKLSNDTSLGSLNITSNPSGTLSPTFQSSYTGEYTYSYPATALSVDITATVNDTDKARINIYEGTIPTGESTLNTATNTLTIPSATKATIVVTAEDGTIGTHIINLTRQLSSDANLKTLSLSSGTLSPNFTSGNVLYNAIVEPEIDYVTVDAQTNSIYGSIKSITGNNLSFGSNTITVTVEAEDDSDKSYVINVTRKKYINADLSDIKIDSESITNFDSSDTSYDVTVPYNSNKIVLSATSSDTTYGTISGTGEINLHTGANVVKVTGIAHNTDVKKVYTLNITRELNSDTGITGIQVAGNAATLNTTTGNYEVTIPNNVIEANSTNVAVSVNSPRVSTDAKATYVVPTVSLTTLVPNNMVIRVTAENGDYDDYTIIITRSKSNIATLSDITVTNGSFNPSVSENVYEYTVLVPKTTTTFNVSATKTEEHASLGGTGEYELVDGKKTVELTVISQDESTTKKYVLNVEKIKSTDNTLKNITITSGSDTFSLLPVFNADTTSYSTSVPGIITNVTVAAETNNEYAEIISGTGSHDLVTGNNTVTIRVKSEAGANLDYTININRLKKTNSYLSDIKIDNTSITEYVKTTKIYDLGTVPYSKESIIIDATLDDSDATIEDGTGIKNLTTGLNTFEINTKAQDGTKSKYTLTIYRTKNNDANLKVLSVNGALLSPSYSPNVITYRITVPNSKSQLLSSDVTALANDNNASVIKESSVNLQTDSDATFNIVVTAENGTDTKTYQIIVTREKSTDNTLKSVSLEHASLEPTFNSETTSYTLSVPYGQKKFTITGVKNNEKATVQGNGEYLSNVGTVSLAVTSETGVIKTYVFNVIEAPSNDATLNNLSITGYPLSQSFITTRTVYDIGKVPYVTNTLTVNAQATNTNATIEYYINGNKSQTNVITLPTTTGTGTISVKVTAADGNTTKTYNISFNKVYSDNAYLKTIIPSTGTLSFSKTTFIYPINVGVDDNSISFELETDDSNAEIKVLNNTSFNTMNVTMNNLVTGTNQLDILVTAQDGVTKKTYTITVNKAAPAPSSNAYLSSLSVNGYSLSQTFNNEVFEYSIGEIPYKTETLTINATTSHSGATINYIVGNANQSSNVVSTPIENGQKTITISVIAEDGSVKNYKINYSKTASTNAYLRDIVLSSSLSLTPAFNKNTTQYDLHIPDEITQLNVQPILDDDKSTMSINGELWSSGSYPFYSVYNNQTINIIVTAEDGTVIPYNIVIKKPTVAKEITSSNYGHTIEDNMIKTAVINNTGADIKNQLDNDNEYLELWNASDTEKLEDTTPLATGQIVKLIINNVEEDRKTIVVKGDVDGSGVIDLFDAVKILNHYLQRSSLTGSYLQAGDTNKDGTDDLMDAVLILNHYLERSSLFS